LDDLIFCSVGEAPDALHLKRDASFVVASESIEDWMINHGGTAFGGSRCASLEAVSAKRSN
jgi:hypothetical protein